LDSNLKPKDLNNIFYNQIVDPESTIAKKIKQDLKNSNSKTHHRQQLNEEVSNIMKAATLSA
tara:strand:- start:150 stop:335 length:186 start_codon:yes stop_codon:yes gene_type:complete